MRTEVTIDFKGVDIVVEGNYIEGEREVYNYGDGSGYPGSLSDFEIEKISVIDSTVDIYEFFSDDDLETIVDLVIENIED